MSSNIDGSKNLPRFADSRAAVVDSPSTESPSVPPPRPATSAVAVAFAAAAGIGLQNSRSNDDDATPTRIEAAHDDEANDAPPIPPAQISADYGEMDAAIKESIENQANDVDAPAPPAQVGAAYDRMDAAIKESTERIRAIDDVPPPPPTQIASAYDEEMGDDCEINYLKKRATPKTGDDTDTDFLDTPPPNQDDSNIHQNKPSSAIPPSSSPLPISQGVSSSNSSSNARGRERVSVRPPPRSMRSPTYEGTNTSSAPAQALPSPQPSVPVLEATLVPEIPIYDAVQIPDEVPVALEDEEKQTWLKRNSKQLIFGGMGLLLGLGVAVAVGLSLGSNNAADGNEGRESEVIIAESTSPPMESFAPSRVPSSRPTVGPSQSANPSHSPSSSLRPSLPPSTSEAPTPHVTCGEINILTDSYRREITWTLARNVTAKGTSDFEVVIEGAPEYAGKNTDEVCLEKGEYEFAIFDSGGDGICCRYGEGSYTVTMDGVVVAQGGDFENKEIAYFSLPLRSPSPSGSLSPSEIPSSSSLPSLSSTYRSTLNWNQQGQSINGDELKDGLGGAVALSSDGMTLAIGAPRYWDIPDVDNDDRPGFVKVFRWEGEGSRWQQRGDTIYGETDGDGFGLSLSLSGDGETLSIGAPRLARLEFGSAGRGNVTVYKWDKDIFNYKPIGGILYGEAPVYRFGRAVDLSSDGKILAVGGGAGQVNVFEWDEVGLNYRQRGEVVTGTVSTAAGNSFGDSVALSRDGKKLASGGRAFHHTGRSGQVDIFVWNEASFRYEQLGDSIVGDEEDDSFGFAISFSDDGSTLAIGGPHTNNANGGFSGQVRIFGWDDDTSIFKRIGQLNGEGGNLFGESVSLSSDGKVLAIGARGGGYAEVYGWNDAALIYEKLGDRLTNEVGVNLLSNSVAISADGKVLAAGAWGNDDNGVDSGQVKVFKIE